MTVFEILVCDHDWLDITTVGNAGDGTHYLCIKCDETKLEKPPPYDFLRDGTHASRFPSS